MPAKEMDNSKYPYQRLTDRVFKDSEQTRDQQHYVQLLETGQDALLSRIHLIRSATKNIRIQTFIWTNDESGRFVFFELLMAAKRGVQIKILIDQWASNKDPQFIAFMTTAHPNIEVRYYNAIAKRVRPNRWHIFKEMLGNFRLINQRMHNKTFLIDEEICIVGGRNYENTYYEFSRIKNFKDRDLLIIGPIVKEILQSFFDYWDFELSQSAKDLKDVKPYILYGNFKKYATKASCQLYGLLKDIDRLADDASYINDCLIKECVPVKKIKFVVDVPQKNFESNLAGGGVVADELERFFRSAKQSIMAQTPYLVLSKRGKALINQLREELPQLDFIVSTTSLAAMDNIYAYALTFKQRKMFLKKLKIRIFELKPIPHDIKKMMPQYEAKLKENIEDIQNKKVLKTKINLKEGAMPEQQKFHLCLHAKTFIIDKKAVWIGSYNVDPRSENLNTELAIIIEDEPFTKIVSDIIERDILPQNSWTVGNRKDLPFLSCISGVFSKIIPFIPFLNIWPYQYVTCFEIEKGKEILPFDHPDFYTHYVSVGSFPDINLDIKEIELSLFEAIGPLIKPIV